MNELTVNKVQDEIIQEFSVLGNDRESTIFYIMELGKKLAPLDEKFKTEENLIRGCQSKVWLTAEFSDNVVHFRADSNTEITKGLISLLLRILSGRKPDEILNTDLYFLERIGMNHIIGSQRSNGLLSMIKQIKLYGLAYKAKSGSLTK